MDLFIYLSMRITFIDSFLFLPTAIKSTMHIPNETCRIANDSSGKISNQNSPIGPRLSFGAEYLILHWKFAHTRRVDAFIRKIHRSVSILCHREFEEMGKASVRKWEINQCCLRAAFD